MANLANKKAPYAQNTPAGPKLEKLRAALTQESLGGFLIPRADEYQGEFVASYAERLKWLTGFTGSAGIAAVLKDKAVVMSDGRYTLQLPQQVDKNHFETADSTQISMAKWLASNAPKGAVIGYDPKLHTEAEVKKLEAEGVTLRPCANLVDRVWDDQPAPPQGALSVFNEGFAGLSVSEKIARTAEVVEKAEGVATIITMPDSIAWVLNIRGADMGCIPYTLATMIVAADGKAHLFIDPAKLTDEVRAHLAGKVALHTPDALETILSGVMLKGVMQSASKPVLLDSGHAPVYYRHLVEKMGGAVKELRDPVLDLKALKTEAEKTAIRAAHVADGVAMVKFLDWLDRDGLNGQQSEISVAETLQSFRAEEAAFKDLSFETIAGCGPNGAIVHYRASEDTNRALESGTLILVDSGAQYYGPAFTGTTDITRTVALGEPTSEMRKHFTLVLKGHIALAKAQFPAGVTGAQVDVLARHALWNEGLDYAHGTGHGVGCYLGVHEEASSISKAGTKPLEAGMLLSNEPGYYKAGAYGIRIENLVFVEKRGICPDSGKDLLGFETVTLAPIDRRLIDETLLSRPELEWLNDYHARVRKTLAPLLDDQRKAWLDKATAPIPFP